MLAESVDAVDPLGVEVDAVDLLGVEIGWVIVPDDVADLEG